LTSALEGGEGSESHPGRTFPPRKDPEPIVQEAGWASGPVWTGAEYLTPTEIFFLSETIYLQCTPQYLLVSQMSIVSYIDQHIQHYRLSVVAIVFLLLLCCAVICAVLLLLCCSMYWLCVL